ncbi:LRR receptor-like serine/threonine-protein kinase RPK2 [Aristolochia californica]|uniref:LRR receptor-like serine/threonine-protein kinase RPK2 n=1 Tax=Aristolochia californica TaxID=171875 RepID=UPI0035DC41C8
MDVTAFFILLLACRCSSGIASSFAGDLTSLLSFKSFVSSDPSNLLTDWNPAGKNHCEWYGVTCDRVSGRVTALNITGSRVVRSSDFPWGSLGSLSELATNDSSLVGTLSQAIANLTELRNLSLPYNAFFGEIPVQIGKLLFLEILELQGNNFSGRIPDQISDVSSLIVLDLAYNSLSGLIPEDLVGLSRIKFIDLSHNQLSGGIKVNRFSCQSLTYLRLSDNFLVGKIPPDIGNCSSLRSLLLNGNILEGRIPVEIGRLSELQILDVSRNSLTDRIPKQLGNCMKLSVMILTNIVSFQNKEFGDSIASGEEFNAFVGEIPREIFSLPNLEILWAPRANLNGHLPYDWNNLCRLRVLNLAQNYRIIGQIPERLGMCRNLSILDLSSNDLKGSVPLHLRANCMVYLNLSRNALSGSLPEWGKTSCGQYSTFFQTEALLNGYSSSLLSSTWLSWPFTSVSGQTFAVLHDFSWNNFTGHVPLFSLGDEFLSENEKLFYGLSLNNNLFNGSLPTNLFLDCDLVEGFAVNLSVNQISGAISSLGCLKLKGFEAAHNELMGSIPTGTEVFKMLSHLDLRGNRMNGTLPHAMGESKNLKSVLLGGNNFTGEIPPQLGEMPSLTVLDLSKNYLTGNIPGSLASASHLKIVLLDHNKLTGEIPPSFSKLANLTILDVSFNNLSGNIPYLGHLNDCDYFQGNSFLQLCTNLLFAPPVGRPFPLQGKKGLASQRNKLKPFSIALVSSASLIVIILIILILILVLGRRRRRLVRNRILRKLVVTFTDVPPEFNYENIVRSTGNFSVQNLIGTGGFGATYKAELLPGYLVAVKRLSIGKFQGLQQFDAEIRTLGRIRHKNLVTLIGYHMGGTETFLIYNYLSGGNLETFIHDRSTKNMQWPIIQKFALDIANALAYLHESCVPRIVHRDIKPSNILLDDDLNAYLSDFGLARLLEVSETHATTDVAGTFGYVAPEYATTCRVSDKSDVYSYGVVLLELMSGKRSLDPSFSDYGNGFNIVAWGELLIKEGRFSEIFSPDLWEAAPKDHLIGILRLASACTVESLSVRPSMRQVVERLRQLK